VLNFKFLFFPKINFFLGSSLFYRYDFFFFFGLFEFYKKNFLNFNEVFDNISFVSDYLGRISAFELGFFSGINSLL
jgi:hypothetical protein